MRFAVCSLLLCLFTASSAHAERRRFFDLEGFGSWLDGNPESTAVTEDGRIELPTPARQRFEDAAITFSAATAWGDDVVVARVDDGGVMLIDRAGKTRDLFQAEEPIVSDLLVAGDALYVGTGAPAKLYRVNRSGKAEQVFAPDAAYIWDMAAGENGALYLATGEPGRVVRVDRKGNGREIFAPEQKHLRSIAHDKELGVFVGGGERGILYRGKAKGKDYSFKALFDSEHPEITGIIIQKARAFITAVTGAQALAEWNEGKKGPKVRSQLVGVAMDGTSEVLAGSNDEATFALAADDRGRIVVATGATGREDPRGRLYAVDPDKRLISMTYQSPSRRITHLVPLPRGAMAAVASGGGRVTHLAGGIAKTGTFITEPFDANIHAKYGMVELFGRVPKGTQATASVRIGQTKEPDDTWSDWSKPIAYPGRMRPQVRSGRFAQIKLTLTGNGRATPSISRVRLAYLRQNLRPFVREVVALRKGLALVAIPGQQKKGKSIDLDGKPSADDRKPSALKKPKARARQIERAGALTVRWSADDPNGDDLEYDLMVRGVGEAGWRTIEDKMDDPFYTLEAAQLPDGHYQFKVRATDAPSNPAGVERDDTRESRAVLVDNTPPSIDPLSFEVRSGRVTARTVVSDAVGPLVEAEYSVDGEPMRMVNPDDGILDGPGETITLRLGALAKGVHSLTLRVLDEGGNVGHAEGTFTVP